MLNGFGSEDPNKVSNTYYYYLLPKRQVTNGKHENYLVKTKSNSVHGCRNPPSTIDCTKGLYRLKYYVKNVENTENNKQIHRENLSFFLV